MAHEKLPNKDTGAAFDEYLRQRRKIAGSEFLKSGGKTLLVGAYTTAAVMAAAIGITISTSVGVLLAGGALAYGGIKGMEGIGRRLRALKLNFKKHGGGHH